MQKLNRDGVSLAYDESGRGEPAIVLIHGWTCDRTYFAPQAEHFSRADRVIAVDLRGHGDSDTPVQDYTMAQFADDIAWLCQQLRIESRSLSVTAWVEWSRSKLQPGTRTSR